MTDTATTTDTVIGRKPAVRTHATFSKVSTFSMTGSEVLLDADGVAVRTALKDEGALLWQLARDAGGIDLNSP